MDERLDQLAVWLKEVTYKPDYELRIVERDEKLGEPALHIVAHVADSCFEDRRQIEVIHRYAINDLDLTDQAFNEFVFDCVVRSERHEAEEWFRINGEQLHEPHRVSADKSYIATLGSD